MSRIVSSGSQEIQEYKIEMSSERQVNGRRFAEGKVTGTFNKAEVESLIDNARREAAKVGALEAEKRLKQPLEVALQNVELVMDEISKFRRELFKEAEIEVLETIRFLSKKILFKEISLDPQIMKSLTEKALEYVEKEKQVSIVFNANDFKLFNESRPEFLKHLATGGELRVGSDSQLTEGQAILKTETMQLDIKLNDMIDHLLDQVLQSKVSDKSVDDDGGES